jgi:DNA repair protein RadA/Sms
MSKNKSQFVCQSCGYRAQKMAGKCPDCGQWNTMVEEIIREPLSSKLSPNRLNDLSSITSDAIVDLSEAVSINDISIQPVARTSTTIPEFDRVLGGGIVNGSVVLVGGEPGIGKSTLMLQMAAGVDVDVLYVSGEESVRQIRSRAERLGSTRHHLKVLSETNLNKIVKLIMTHRPALVIVDSIQTMYREEIESAPGSISQIRESAALLMHVAKSLELSVFLVGHVTKDGSLAGPKVMEHIVDTVLQFEGDANHLFRILRAKCRKRD